MSFDKISVTAKLTAYMRQFSDIPYAKDIAEAVHARQAFDDLVRTHGLSPGDLLWYAPIFEVRYKSIAARLRASGIDQVLELASGLSLRGLAMTEENAELTYVETDLEGLTAEKRTLVAGLRRRHRLPDNERHQLRTANALELPALWHATVSFHRDRPIAVVSEGLLQYLSAAELEQVAGNVHALLDAFAPGGLWLTPDFSFKDEAAPLSERQRRFRAVVTGATDRQMYENAFADGAAMEAFLARLRFTSLQLRQLDEVSSLTSPAAVGLAPETVDRLRPRLRLWLLSATS